MSRNTGTTSRFLPLTRSDTSTATPGRSRERIPLTTGFEADTVGRVGVDQRNDDALARTVIADAAPLPG